MFGRESVLLFIDLVDTFRSKSDNKNYNYTCLELFWGLADSLKTRHLPDDSELWQKLFSKLSQSAIYPDAQVRNSSLQIMASILSDHGDLFDSGLWEYCLCDLFFPVFDEVLEIYLNLRLQKGADLALSPEAIQTLRASFQAQKVQREKGQAEVMVAHHSGEKLDILWEETFLHLVQAFSKISKKYLTRISLSTKGRETDILRKIFDSLYFVMRLPEKEVFIETLKALKVVLSSDSEALTLHQQDLQGLLDLVLKSLSKETSEAELTKVRQTVIPEVYLMLESYLDCKRLFVSELSVEIFFAILHRLIVFQVVGYVDKFKIFLEERYVSVVFKKFPHALSTHGPIFMSQFFKFLERLYSMPLDNSMANVVLNNLSSKLAEVFLHIKGVSFPPYALTFLAQVEGLVRKIYDESYISMVKHSKNYKEMICFSACILHSSLLDALLQDPYLETLQVSTLLSSLVNLAQDIRKEKVKSFELLRVDCLKEFVIFLLHHPKSLQRAILLASQRETPPKEISLLASMEEVRQFEEFLKTTVAQTYSLDSECKVLVSRMSKSLLETNQRLLAAICSDVEQSAQAYLHLLNRYVQAFQEYLGQAKKGKPDENLRDDVIDHLNNLASIKMDKPRAEAFIRVANISKKSLDRFGPGFVFMPMLGECLPALVRVEDSTVREGVSQVFRELLAEREAN